jgi:hypothetical protein
MMIAELRRSPLVIAGLAWLCAGPALADVFVRSDIITDPAPGKFSVCHGFSCAQVTQVGLNDAQWFAVTSVFEHAAATPEEERAQIAQAIGKFETIVGVLAGTSGDLGENSISGLDLSGQMDCIDESTNTTTYLRILVKAGFLRWHRVEDRVTRGWFLFGWPHTTAVVSEREGGRRWAIDSWFFANGHPPAVAPLEVWQRGWRPGKATETAKPLSQ